MDGETLLGGMKELSGRLGGEIDAPLAFPLADAVQLQRTGDGLGGGARGTLRGPSLPGACTKMPRVRAGPVCGDIARALSRRDQTSPSLQSMFAPISRSCPMAEAVAGPETSSPTCTPSCAWS